MFEDDLVLLGVTLSLAQMGLMTYLSYLTYRKASARGDELRGRLDDLARTGLAVNADLQSASSALDTKLSRGAMQRVTHQAKDLASRIIESAND